MLNIFKKNKTKPSPSTDTPPQKSWLTRLGEGLKKSSQRWQSQMSTLFSKQTIDHDWYEELEDLLLTADIGLEVSEDIISRLKSTQKKQGLSEGAQLLNELKTILLNILTPYEGNFVLKHTPSIILMVGANGNGKTTAIGKLAHYFKQKDHQVMVAAGDTFRAAATEQLEVWAKRADVPLIAQHIGADSASVLFDALQSARAKSYDIILGDTAGRLHAREDLMRELKKITTVLNKQDASAPHETWLVLDATVGQNAIEQVKTFQTMVPLTGLILTKLDGTAKGGIIFNLAQRFKLPIHFIGVGEQLEDLQPFSALDFVETLLSGLSNHEHTST